MILPHLELVALSAVEYVDVVRDATVADWTGGKIHDRSHLKCAQTAGCHRIYTCNVKDFRALAPPTFQDKISAP